MVFRSLTPFRRQDPDRDSKLPADPFYRMQHQINDMFDNAFGAFGRSPFDGPMFGGGVTPKLDVKETGRGFKITAELPGVAEEDVHVDFADNVLTIRGEKKVEKEEEDKGYHVMERSYGSFARSIPLGFEVDPDAVEANFKKGVLTITLPKPPEIEAKTRKIEIKRG